MKLYCRRELCYNEIKPGRKEAQDGLWFCEECLEKSTCTNCEDKFECPFAHNKFNVDGLCLAEA